MLFSYSKRSNGHFKNKISTEIIDSNFINRCVELSRKKNYKLVVWDKQEGSDYLGYLTKAEAWLIITNLIGECLDFDLREVSTARFVIEYKNKTMYIFYGNDEDKIELKVERDFSIPFISNLRVWWMDCESLV